ncbi:MAG: amidohydrolase family protein [Alphaproteobacteria bacterium]|nr:amidohydrolase family protein [Alphaproteobacteria bacterium]
MVALVRHGPITAPAAQAIDLGGRVVMPGLIDCHVHVTAALVNLWAMDSMMPSLVTASAGAILRGMILRGYTSVRDAGGADLGVKVALERGLFTGPRLFISGHAISETGGHGDFRARVFHGEPCSCGRLLSSIGRIADGVDAVRAAVRDEIRLGADQIKIMASGSVGSPTDRLTYLAYSKPELEAFTDEAARHETYVMAHAYTAAAIRRCVEAGVRSIEHGNLVDAEVADLMAERGVFLVPTLVAFETLANHGRDLGFPAEAFPKIQHVLEVGTRSLEIARRAGVKIAIGSDLLGELHRFQTREFTIRSQALPAAEILRSATTIGAELLQMCGRLGVIAPGAFADLLVVDGDPLADIAVLVGEGERLAAIMKGGQWVKNTLAP